MPSCCPSNVCAAIADGSIHIIAAKAIGFMEFAPQLQQSDISLISHPFHQTWEINKSDQIGFYGQGTSRWHLIRSLEPLELDGTLRILLEELELATCQATFLLKKNNLTMYVYLWQFLVYEILINFNIYYLSIIFAKAILLGTWLLKQLKFIRNQ